MHESTGNLNHFDPYNHFALLRARLILKAGMELYVLLQRKNQTFVSSVRQEYLIQTLAIGLQGSICNIFCTHLWLLLACLYIHNMYTCTTEALQFKGKKHSLCMLVPLGNTVAVEFGELPS